MMFGFAPTLSLLLLLTTTRAQEEDFAVSSPYYFDNLRTKENLTVVSGIDVDETDSNVFQVTLEDGQDYVLADLKSFFPFSHNGSTLLPSRINLAFTSLLAVYHFNNVDKSGILTEADLAECPNLKLTMELFDTNMSPIVTTRTFTSVLQRMPSFQVPPSAAVIGAYRSAVTSPLAILTGVNQIPQVSAASTAVDFDIKSQFPYFGRTVTSSVGEAEVAVQFFKSINSNQVAILFVTDSFGSALQKAFQDAANEAGIMTESVPFSFLVDKAEAKTVIESLKETSYRHVYAILFEVQFNVIMETAYEMGAAGPDYLYIFPGVDVSAMVEGQTVQAGTPLAHVFNGAGYIQMEGGVTSNPLVLGEPAPLGPSEPGSGYDSFRRTWREALEDEEFVQYVRSKLPASTFYVEGSEYDPSIPFASDPGSYRPFTYDAVTGIALSMCRAMAEKQDVDGNVFFNGSSVYDKFTELEFIGSTGNVEIDNVTGTRDYKTINFVMWNSRTTEFPNGSARVEFVPALYYGEDYWVPVGESQFMYPDNTFNATPSLPPVDFDYNYIGKSGRIAGYTLMGFTICAACLCLLWLVIYRKEHVVCSAQPLFLIMVSFGTMCMSLTIFPLSLEETVVATEEGLDMACMSIPWLYVAGSTVALSGLLAKTRGVVQAYLNPELDFIHVSGFDIFAFFLMYFMPNLVILVVWTTVSPLRWHRIPTGATDVFGRVTASYAQCDGPNALAFVIAIGAFNFFTLLLGNWWAYRARNIETEYSESSYTGVSMAAVLQAWTMGVPILIVVWNSPPAKFYVSSGIIFVTAHAILCLVYIPKMIALYKAQRERADKKKIAYSSFIKDRLKKDEFEDDDADFHVNHASGGGNTTVAELAAAAAVATNGVMDDKNDPPPVHNPQDPTMTSNTTNSMPGTSQHEFITTQQQQSNNNIVSAVSAAEEEAPAGGAVAVVAAVAGAAASNLMIDDEKIENSDSTAPTNLDSSGVTQLTKSLTTDEVNLHQDEGERKHEEKKDNSSWHDTAAAPEATPAPDTSTCAEPATSATSTAAKPSVSDSAINLDSSMTTGSSPRRSGSKSMRFSNILKNSLLQGMSSTKNMGETTTNNKGIGGIKITHHPRAQHNLAVSGGLEMSRKQIDYLRDCDDDDDDDNGNAETTTTKEAAVPIAEVNVAAAAANSEE